MTAAGEVVFVVSKRPVRFHDFATLFRDELDCPNALFLDGTISSLYAPDINRHDRLFPMGPMIAVVGKFPREVFLWGRCDFFRRGPKELSSCNV